MLFATLEKLAAEGCAILYISHKLEEVKALCETATILRHGKVVAHCDPREKTAREMAELMVGDQIAWVERENAGEAGIAAKTRLAVFDLNLPAEDRIRCRSEGHFIARPFGRNRRNCRDRR